MSRTIGTTACPKCRERGHDTRGNNLVLYNDGGSHCFACGYHTFPKHYKTVIKEKPVVSSVLPSDFQREVPAIAWKWLLKYGLPMSYWRPYVGYSEKDSRLVFTVGDPTIFSIGRDISGDSEIRCTSGSVLHNSRTKGKWFVWGDSHKTATSIGESATKTVFVEDIVSAHKVGRVATAVPIFGTTIYPSQIRLARKLGLPVVLWLDKDQQGTTYKKANYISMATGLPCEVVHTDLDPKELTLEEIKEQLNV